MDNLKGSIKPFSVYHTDAYMIAVKNGFEGTEAEWLESLKMSSGEVEAAVTKYLKENPVGIDKTLTVSGEAADAKATGEAIAAVQKTAEELVAEHENNKDNPHAVTAEQVGARPSDWMPTAAEVGAVPASHAEDKNNPHGVTAEQIGAQEQHLHFVVNLPVSGWANNSQTVACEGVTANNTLIVASAPENYDAYAKAGVYCSAQAVGSLTFTCKSVPSTDLNANVMILT